MELCEVVDMEGRVVNGEELEAVGGSVGWSVDGGRATSGERDEAGAGGGRSRARLRRRAMSDVDDADAEDDDGMEIS